MPKLFIHKGARCVQSEDAEKIIKLFVEHLIFFTPRSDAFFDLYVNLKLLAAEKKGFE